MYQSKRPGMKEKNCKNSRSLINNNNNKVSFQQIFQEDPIHTIMSVSATGQDIQIHYFLTPDFSQTAASA